ncbi:ATP-binding cassette domain-containing protein [Erysipelothrix sp. D19-032]
MSFIIGPSGVGKSTFFKLLNSTLSVDNHQIYYNDRDINTLDPIALRQDLLLCGQSVFLFLGSIRDNFNQFRELRHLESLTDTEISAFLKIAEAQFDLGKNVDVLSGGERQRVYIAIFVSLATTVLLLDEPTVALDKATGSKVLENIKNYIKTKQMTALVISHDPDLAREYADALIDFNLCETR